MKTETKRNIFIGICIGIIVFIALGSAVGFEKVIRGVLFTGALLLIYLGIVILSELIFPKKK